VDPPYASLSSAQSTSGFLLRACTTFAGALLYFFFVSLNGEPFPVRGRVPRPLFRFGRAPLFRHRKQAAAWRRQYLADNIIGPPVEAARAGGGPPHRRGNACDLSAGYYQPPAALTQGRSRSGFMGCPLVLAATR
jgi:hypothetical protein